MSEVRADIVYKRTYSRPFLDGLLTENWSDTIDRVIAHQVWLWERALTHKKYPSTPLKDLTEDMKEWVTLNNKQMLELAELRELFINKKALPSGRTLWLGGTEIAQRRESSQFNCSHICIETVYDVVDAFWLLLQGCGVGFTPVVGTLTGFKTPIKNLKIIRSKNSQRKGIEVNEEVVHNGEWYLSIGDSAESWAKSIGKIIAGKHKVHTLTLDFSQIRAPGIRLKQYGWISSGDIMIHKAYSKIFNIMNKRAGGLLRKIDILDIVNLLGTVLSSRRSAEIALVEYGSDEWKEFARAKQFAYKEEFEHRQQSNNSLVFYNKPTREQLEEVFDILLECGGSEPGIINGQGAKDRAPYFKGVNPCAEILLGNKSFCNLVEVDIAKFKGDQAGLLKTINLVSRANYRQTVVDFRDGILQESWHLNNQFLRLCGTGLTGISQRDDLTAYDYKMMRYEANCAARGMARELGLEIPKNVTTVKPSGTLSKVMNTTEGIHKPVSKYIFNWINFSINDPLVEKLKEANYQVVTNPNDESNKIINIPIEYSDDLHFTKTDSGKYMNTETVLDQLERYKKLVINYVDHNVSNTISYRPNEIPLIIDWLLDNWENYIAISFLPKVEEETFIGYNYLPQTYVTKEEYESYVSTLKPINWIGTDSSEEIDFEDCEQGICPVR